jgi:hypothetical protein
MDTERDAGTLLLLHTRPPQRRLTGRAGYWLWLFGALVVLAVAHRRLGPNSVGHDLDDGSGDAVLGGPCRCWSRPTTTRLPPLMTDPTPIRTA